MKHEARKAALETYRERKVAAGVYALRCAATGQVWVGRAPDLSTIRNRLWFTLKHGSHSHRALQAAWNAHGEDGFAFEAVEALKEVRDESRYLRDRRLKDRLDHWRDALDAAIL